MEESSEKVIESKKKTARRKYIIGAIVIFLCILAGYVYKIVTWEPKSDPESEKIIRQIVAKQINKDPNKLTDEDFAKITELTIEGTFERPKILSDIILLEKFTNLQFLRICHICYPTKKNPKWLKVLEKFGLYDLNQRYSIDLGPIKKLTQLEKFEIIETPIRNFKSIEKLTILQDLKIMNMQVSNFEHVKKLKNLKSLHFHANKISDLEAIKGLINLQRLEIVSPKSLEPIKGLINLQKLGITFGLVSDLEPIKGLKNLQYLTISFCENISDEQVKDLKKALPNLKITILEVPSMDKITLRQ